VNEKLAVNQMATKSNQSATKLFTVLDVLWRNFANGYTPGELAKASSGGFWAWFFEPIATKLNFVDFDLPPIANLTVTITLNGAATDLIGCGGIVVGLGQELGGTQYGATVGIVDYSRKTKDAWGNWSVFEGAYSDRGSFQLQIDRVAVDSTKAVLAKYRATPIVYVGSDSYDSTIIYGYFKDFSIAIAYATFSVCTLDIEGLT
jgi:hypothetical protein